MGAGGEGDAEDEMVGWHHGLNGHEFEQAPGVGDGQGSLVCCYPWGHKESDITEQLNLRNVLNLLIIFTGKHAVLHLLICVQLLNIVRHKKIQIV